MQIITLYAHRSYHVGTINFITILQISKYYVLVAITFSKNKKNLNKSISICLSYD